MKGTLLKSKALTDEWTVRYTTYKTIPGIKGVMGSHSRIPEYNYIPMHPDHILYLCPGDNGSVINFEIVEILNEYADGARMVKYAKLINEEKSTKSAVEWIHELSKQREPDKFDWQRAKEIENILTKIEQKHMNALDLIDEHQIIRETVGYEFLNDVELVDLPEVMKFLKIVYNYKKLKTIEHG